MCVVSLEETDITPASVPYEQCREIRTEGIGTSRQLDYIIIPASAAIVATVIIAVIIFIACLKTSQKKRDGKVRKFSFKYYYEYYSYNRVIILNILVLASNIMYYMTLFYRTFMKKNQFIR